MNAQICEKKKSIKITNTRAATPIGLHVLAMV